MDTINCESILMNEWRNKKKMMRNRDLDIVWKVSPVKHQWIVKWKDNIIEEKTGRYYHHWSMLTAPKNGTNQNCSHITRCKEKSTGPLLWCSCEKHMIWILLQRNIRKTHIEGQSTLLELTLRKSQGHESHWNTRELFQTLGHEETWQLNTIYGSEHDLCAIKRIWGLKDRMQ